MNVYLQFLAWVSLPVLLILFGAGFVYLVAPQAIGETKSLLSRVPCQQLLRVSCQCQCPRC